LLRNNKVYLRRRCPEHGEFEALVYGDAQAYTSATKFNKPGTVPLEFTTAIQHGCPHDCGLCPDHQQHACLGIIEVNSACNMDCPLCFANAGAGFNLTLEEVEGILDHLVETEGNPEVVQFSGGEPSIHPQIVPMMRAAKARNIRHVMLNTNGKRIANDDASWLIWQNCARRFIFSLMALSARPIASCAASQIFWMKSCERWTGWR
jgi:uncharacterized radical SAM superfamily Fe-S cluster-containing enzyme